MIGQTLTARTKGAATIQIVGQSGNGYVAVDVEGGSPFVVSPALLHADYGVEPVAPTQPDEQQGWAELARQALANARHAALHGDQRPTPEQVFADAAAADA